MWTYRLRYVRCGKENCHCVSGVGHGPYWYGYRHRGGRTYSKYFGGHPTSQFDYHEAPEPPASISRWYYGRKMTWKAALRIMAFDAKPSADILLSRYRALAFEHHPDRGGSNQVMAAINAAYAYLR